jgi:RNA polymerase sigma-70 factor (ECF subfamily)
MEDTPPPAKVPSAATGVSDEELAARAARGDAAAFDRLVVLYSSRVFAVAFRMLNDRGEAEDLAQEVFVTLFHSIGTFRGESKLSTWIYRITKNRCLNRIKFLGRRHIGTMNDIDDPAVARGVVDPETIGSGQKDPHTKMRRDELSAVLEVHLAKLPEEQRTLVVLRDLEELTYDEIVEVTELPLGTVKSRLHRARAALAKTLGPALAELEAGERP